MCVSGSQHTQIKILKMIILQSVPVDRWRQTCSSSLHVRNLEVVVHHKGVVLNFLHVHVVAFNLFLCYLTISLASEE